MLVYFILYVLLLLLACLLPRTRMEEHTRRLVMACLVGGTLVLLLGFRHPSMGIDLGDGRSFGYIHSFFEISSMSAGEILLRGGYLNYELGYVFLNKLIGLIWLNEQFFLFVTATLTVLPIVYVVYRRSENLLYSTVVYLGLPVFLLSFSGLRQGLAIAVCFLALLCIEHRQPVRFILLIFLAATFHSSAVVFLFAYPLYYIRLSRAVRILGVFAFPLVYFLRTPLFSVLAELFGYEAFIDNNNSVTLFFAFCLIYLVCCLFFENDSAGYAHLFFVACCIQGMAGVNSVVLRAGYDYIMPLLLLLPNTVLTIRDRATKWTVSLGLLVCFVAFGLYSLYVSGMAETYPYIPFWNA